MQTKLRATIGVLAIASLLSACGLVTFGPTTPLTEAIAALRSGDHDALRRVREKAQTLMQVTKPRGCGLDEEVQRRRGEVLMIAKLDNDKVFDVPAHERLVYLFNLFVQLGGDESEESIEDMLARMSARCRVCRRTKRKRRQAPMRAHIKARPSRCGDRWTVGLQQPSSGTDRAIKRTCQRPHVI
jgi:hypothetical protein